MLRLKLVTLEGIKLDEEVYEVLLPTPDGQIGVFLHHAPVVTLATPGVITVRKKAGDNDQYLDHYAISGGVIEVMPTEVRVMVDAAEHDKEIDEKAAADALMQAKELLAKAKDQVSLDQAQAMVDREATRLRVAELRRRRKV